MDAETNSMEKIVELDKILEGCKTLLILMHDYPDPDALASATLLSYLVRRRYGARTRLAYGGLITRAENRAMVQQMRLKLTQVKSIRWRSYRHIAMVDTQPGFGNNSLPDTVHATIVIDHHPGKNPLGTGFVDVRPQYGTSTSIVLEYLKAAALPITADLATAAAYAIRSETRELERAGAGPDAKAYLELYPNVNNRKLAKIYNPKVPKTYFVVLWTALEKAKVFRHLAHVHLGRVESPEFISQVADLLLRGERTSWVMATGRYEDNLFVSLRYARSLAHAGTLLAATVGELGSAGGHKRMAGGRIPFAEHSDEDWGHLEDILIARFLDELGYKKGVEWRPLLLKDSDL